MDDKGTRGGLTATRFGRAVPWKPFAAGSLLALWVCLNLLDWLRPASSPTRFRSDSLTNALRVAVADDEFDWTSIIPSATLEWVPCYKDFKCARFEVPLDYAKPHGPKAAIALTKYPSKYPVGHEKWRGPILYNPGGPGGSGVDAIRALGANFSRVIGDEFDHVGFDPRGTWRTTPALDVFSSEAERMLWDAAQPPPVNATVDALARAAAYARIMGQLAAQRAPVEAAHMSTALVARDMLKITEAHGRDKLLYWGFSYGTVLGITFASMFPDRVERVVVDGVVDTYNYYAGEWSNNLMDTDKDLGMVHDACVSSSGCALHASNATAIRARIDAIFYSLKARPLVVQNGTQYGLADFGAARRAAFSSLYQPSKAFPRLAAALAAAERGDGAPLFALSDRRADSSWRCGCGGPSEPPPTKLWELRWEVHAAIACGDAEPVSGDLARLERHYAKLAALSEWANVWPTHVFCSGWTVRPVERYAGPFGGNTSFPLLLIGNTADPVTPLWAAKKMSSRFKDAVVLTQNSAGHCSTSSASLCTAKHVRAYFRDGKMPEPETVCEVETNIFEPDDKRLRKGADSTALSVEDATLLSAARDLAARFEAPKFGALF